MGYGLDSLHEAFDPRRAIERAEAIFCGGGNTFRLLKALHEIGVLPLIRRRVAEGMIYSGASAGSNLACPTIRTTNDMPIVRAVVPSTRWASSPSRSTRTTSTPCPARTHMGETRETRIREFHEENEAPVVGLREGAILRVEGESVLLKGLAGARIFRRGQEPVEMTPVAEIGPLLG